MRTATTGIQGLDAHFGGGVPVGSVLLVVSDPSNAPHVFCEQFAVGGLNSGETVYYYNLERPKEEVVERMRTLLTRPDAIKGLQYFDCYSVKFQKLGPALLKRIGIENHAVKVSDDAVSRVLKHPKDAPFRIVVESLTEAIEAYGDEAAIGMVSALAGLAKHMNGLVLVMLVRGMHSPMLETRLRHMADGVIEFGVERQGFGLYSYLSVTKMRGVQDATRLLLYKETDKGLWLESTRRVF